MTSLNELYEERVPLKRRILPLLFGALSLADASGAQEKQEFLLNKKKVDAVQLELSIQEPIHLRDQHNMFYDAYPSEGGYIITDNEGNIILDREIYTPLAKAAHYGDLVKEGLPEELRATAKGYRRILRETDLPQFIMNVGTDMTESLFGLLLHYGVGEGKKALNAAKTISDEEFRRVQKKQVEELKETVKDDLRVAFATEVMQNATPYLGEPIDSDELFTRVMRDMLENAAMKIESAAGSGEVLRGYGTFPLVITEPLSKEMIENISTGYAIPFAFSAFYGKGWDQAKNFLIRHVLRPAADAVLAGSSLEEVIDTQEMLKTYPPALEEFLARKQWMQGYLKERFEKVDEGALDSLRKKAKVQAEDDLGEKFRERGVEEYFSAYKRMRSDALHGDKNSQMLFALFLTDILLPLSPSESNVSGVAEQAGRYASLSMGEFVREYDKAFRQYMGSRKQWYKVAAASWVSMHFQYQTTIPSFAPFSQPSFSTASQGWSQLYNQALQNANSYLTLIEQTQGPSEETRRRRRDMETIQSYHSVFQGGSLSPAQRQNLEFLFSQYIEDLQREIK